MDTLEALRTLSEVVKQGSFSAAARRMGVNRSVVSRTIESLEDELCVRLLNRTTRSLSLTEAGLKYYEGSKKILNDVELLKSSVVESENQLKGSLRIAAPVQFGEWKVLPIVHEFLVQNPDVDIYLELSTRRVNIVNDAFDLVIRTAHHLEDSTFIARQISTNSFIPCATPSYCKRHGEPATPDDLGDHVCIVTHQYSGHENWVFHDQDGTLISVPIESRLKINAGSAQIRAIEQGLGIGLLPEYIVRESEQSERLVRLLPDFPHESYPIYVIYPHRERMALRTRAFVDMLIEKLR